MGWRNKRYAVDMSESGIWIAVGLLGQLFFTSRFLVQWIVSERRRESVIPVAFWWFSLLGGVTLLSYAIWRQDPVFILGQATGLLVYSRNLILIARRGREVSP
ncbi:lipid-A-disaccharide synthase N-terminal domain-containing protein [Palleronia rufa]|uniref:lipid-A-disaccharide synthase N-terminal domain-containing protein n=2 Tax=Palleronia rufa TaxID=1530186 RepID=UPI0039EF4554